MGDRRGYGRTFWDTWVNGDSGEIGRSVCVGLAPLGGSNTTMGEALNGEIPGAVERWG